MSKEQSSTGESGSSTKDFSGTEFDFLVELDGVLKGLTLEQAVKIESSIVDLKRLLHKIVTQQESSSLFYDINEARAQMEDVERQLTIKQGFEARTIDQITTYFKKIRIILEKIVPAI